VVAHWLAAGGLQHFPSLSPLADARKYFNSLICVLRTKTAVQMQRESECGRPSRIGAHATDVGIGDGEGFSNSKSSSRRYGTGVGAALLLVRGASLFHSAVCWTVAPMPTGRT
jgi:hypothetical protein